MTLSKDFYRNIEKIASKAKHTSSKQQVFKDLIQMGFNSMLDPRVRVRMPPMHSGWGDALRVELTAYKPQPEAWNLLTETCQMWLQAIHDGEPFEDILGSSYDEHLGKELGQGTPSWQN